MARKPKAKKAVKALSHKGAKRKNNPTAEHEELVAIDEAKPIAVEHARRNNPDEAPELYERDEDLDPQLVWMGKDEEDREALSVDAVPIYIQEHIHPKAIIEDIRRRASQGKAEGEEVLLIYSRIGLVSCRQRIKSNFTSMSKAGPIV